MQAHRSTGTHTSDLKARLHLLAAEEAAAVRDGLTANRTYMADLRGELEATRAAYVGAAVTEIAVLRASLDGPLVG